jgi:hypothetical protein
MTVGRIAAGAELFSAVPDYAVFKGGSVEKNSMESPFF